MAAAALEVLGLLGEISEYLPPATFVPSPGQGCVAVECRADDDRMIELLGTVDHAPTRRSVELERAFLAELGSGCSLPVGAHATDRILTAFLAADDRSRYLTETVELPDDHEAAISCSVELARSMHTWLQ